MSVRRSHFEVLDGLRGFAALSVVLFHLGHWLDQPGLASNAGFAVDFFFCLSGFVINFAYHKRIGKTLGVGAFIRLRLIRLMPIMAIGTLISASYMVARIVVLNDDAINPAHLGLATILGMLCLPNFYSDQSFGGPQIFPLNGPQYTLFFELFVNFVWVITARFVTLERAIATAVIGYVVVGIIGLGGDTAASFWTGFPRVLASYYAGVAVHQFVQRCPRWADLLGGRIVFMFCLIVTACFFHLPTTLPLPIGLLWSLLMAPILILSGSKIHSTLKTRTFFLAFGELSYPIYALHDPIFVWINATYQQLTHRRDPLPESILVLVGALLGSWLIFKLIDTPVRTWLTKRLNSSGTA